MKILARLIKPFSGKLSAIILIVLLRLSALCSGEFDPSQYKSFKNIEVLTPVNEVVASAQLDSEIYSSTRDNFPGVRIIDQKNTEVPYHIEKAITTQPLVIEKICRSEVKSLRELPDNKIEIIIQLKEDEPTADGLTLITPHKNFERRVSVFGSKNGEDWVEIVSRALVFDYFRYMDVDNRKIDLPENKFRQFRLEVEDIIDEKASPLRNLWLKLNDEIELEHVEQFSVYNRTFRIDRIDLWRKITRQQFEKEVKANYPVVGFKVTQDKDKKRTVITVTSQREPLTSLRIVTPDRNFHRRANVEVKRKQYGSEVWVDIGHETLSTIQGIRQEKSSIKFPEHREEVYRLIINNQDNQPLQISGLEAEGNVYEILYLNNSENKYRLFYGSETAEKPQYDFANVLNSLRESNQSAPAHLSNELGNPDYDSDSDRRSFQIFENKWFLASITAFMVAVLGWILFSTGRKI